jgi:hypothetical protein
MDFDSIIPLLMFIVFFGLPAIFKKIQGKKSSGKAAHAKKAKSSFFGRIGEKIQDAIREADQQKQQGKPIPSPDPVREPDSLWEILAEKEEAQDNSYIYAYEEEEHKPDWDETAVSDWKVESEKPEELEETVLEEEKPLAMIKPAPVCYLSGQYGLNSSLQLRQAVVWSEILGKPVSLRY